MVLYFSATGNTEYVAKKIAKLTGDDSLDLLNRIREKDYSPIHSDKPFVICSPIYVCEMPRFFAAFIKKLALEGDRRVYFITTSGGYAGVAGGIAKRIAKKKGMIFMGHKDIQMAPNYPVSKRYKLLSPEETVERLRAATKEISPVAARIKGGVPIRDRHVFLFEHLIILPFNPVWVKVKQPTKFFSVTDDCIGCGKCAKRCPLGRITMVDKRPHWEGTCAHCMACIANCPVEAIEYAHVKKGVEKYRIGKYLKKKQQEES